MTSLMAFPCQVGEKKRFSTVYNPTMQNPASEETEKLCQQAEKAAACLEK